MRRHRDAGSAVVEFVTLGMLLLIPVIYLVLTVARVQAASFAVDGSARAAARAFGSAPDDDVAYRRAAAAVRVGLADQGFSAGSGALAVECSARPCLTPGERVAVRVQVDVVLPGVPSFVNRVVPSHVTVRSTQLAVVDAFREPPR